MQDFLSVFSSSAPAQQVEVRYFKLLISVINTGFSDVWRQFHIGQSDLNSLLVTEEFFSMKHKGGLDIYRYKNYVIHIFLLPPYPLAQI